MGLIRKITFDGIDSSSYGVGITGADVYNAPEREVEMISIPGRNGDYAFDKGKFSNITISYPAGAYDSDQTNFATKMSNLRNAFASRKGYKRLEDEYNPDEYRMAIFKSGLEASPTHLQMAGEFDLVFDCKPQRFLKSGETAVTVANNGTITNPTLFDAKPLLAVTGYGTISLGSESITINHVALGDVVIKDAETYSHATSKTVTLDTTYANSGDKFKLSASCSVAFMGDTITSASSTHTGNGSSDILAQGVLLNVQISTGDITFAYGTSKTETNSVSLSIVTANNGTVTGSVSFSVAYNGTSTLTLSTSTTNPTSFAKKQTNLSLSQVILDSTKQASTTYIDLEIGEAYTITNNVIASANNIVTIPAELPTLKPGSTTVTFPNTVTQLKITPRWWRI